MRDETDNWNFQQLEKFKACPMVNARRIECIMGQIEIDEDKAIAFAQHKDEVGRENNKAKDQKPAPSPPLMPNPVVTIQSKPSVRLSTARLKTELPPQDSDDAFRRNLEDLRPFIRAFYSQYRRFPTTEEALEWLKTNERYSGEWEDREVVGENESSRFSDLPSRDLTLRNCPREGSHQFPLTVVGLLVVG